MSDKNIKFSTGALFSPIDVRDYKLAFTNNESEFPEEFELQMCKVKNQAEIGSCVAHSIAEIIEYFNMKQNNDNAQMSTNYIYGNRIGMNYDGPGMYTRKAIANACKYGTVYESECPGNTEVPNVIEEFKKIKDELYEKGVPHRFSSYYSVNTKNEIKTALMNNGPVIFAMPWYDDIVVIDGEIQTSQQSDAGGHCMVIYGWNKTGWKIMNSWGIGWAHNGKAILPYNIKIREAYGIIDTIVGVDNVSIKKPYNSSVGKWIAKVLNWILNLFHK